MSLQHRVVIVGAGQAAAQAVEVLRKRGHSGPITLVGDESLLPYQRPPLSKKYLAGSLDRDRLPFRHADHYRDHRVEMRLGVAAARIDRAMRRVTLADDSTLDYDALLLATGTRARTLAMPGAELSGVYTLRTVDDVDRLRVEIAPGRRAVVIGGGYIGLEAAATCREAGLSVTVLEAADRVMARVVSPAVSGFYEAEHRRHGVDVRCAVRLQSLIGGADGRVSAVRLVGGEEIAADFVLVGVGVTPADELARDAGIDCDNGILVDERCCTSDPHIWAAGDCTRHPSVHYGLRVRLESVDNAFEQATSAALNMLGIATIHDKIPWFWSDQFDLKMVIVGLAQGHDELVVRGDPVQRAFSVCYLRAGELIAVETVNHVKDQMAARKLIPARARPDRAKLADPAVALKDCV